MGYIIKDNPKVLNPVDYLKAKDVNELEEARSEFTNKFGYTPDDIDEKFVSFVYTFLFNKKDNNFINLVGKAVGLGAIAYAGYKLGKSLFDRPELQEATQKRDQENTEPKEELVKNIPQKDAQKPSVEVNLSLKGDYIGMLFARSGVYNPIFKYQVGGSPLERLRDKIVELHELDDIVRPKDEKGNRQYNATLCSQAIKSLQNGYVFNGKQLAGMQLLYLASKYFYYEDQTHSRLLKVLKEKFDKFGYSNNYLKEFLMNGLDYKVNTTYGVFSARNVYRTSDGENIYPYSLLHSTTNDDELKEAIASKLYEDLKRRLRFRCIILHYTETLTDFTRGGSGLIETLVSKEAYIGYGVDRDGTIAELYGTIPNNGDGYDAYVYENLYEAVKNGLVDHSKFIDDVHNVMQYLSKPLYITRDVLLDYSLRFASFQIEISNAGSYTYSHLVPYIRETKTSKISSDEFKKKSSISDIEELLKQSSESSVSRTFYKGTVNIDYKVVRLPVSWKSMTYFEKPPESQIEATIKLIKDLSNKYGIKKKVIDRNLFFREDFNTFYYDGVKYSYGKYQLNNSDPKKNILHRYYIPLFQGVTAHTLYSSHKKDLDIVFYDLFKKLSNSGFEEVLLDGTSSSNQDFYFNKNIQLAMQKILKG